MSGLLGIGTSALNAAQTVLDTISNNISNSTNPDYNRQTSELSSRVSMRAGPGFVGTGVEAGASKRTVDKFLVGSLNSNRGVYNELSKFSEFSQQVDVLLSDPNTGVADGLNTFFTSLEDLMNDPGSLPARQVFISSAQVLESRFQGLNRQFTTQIDDANTQMVQVVEEINGLAASIASINQDLVRSGGVALGAFPNDLLDKRDAMVARMSELVNVQTVEEADSTVNVFIGSGQSVVLGSIQNKLSTQTNASDASKLDVTLQSGQVSQVITPNLNGGKLGGLMNVRSQIIEPAMNTLGKIALTMTSAFNQVHQQGIDLKGNFGENLFAANNTIDRMLERAVSDANNQGNGVFSVSIDPIAFNLDQSQNVYSNPGLAQNAGTWPSLNGSGELSLNGVDIRATVPGDDLLSTSDPSASAIAVSNAINEGFSAHKITATPQTNVVNLGTFTPGALGAGEFQINGNNIVSTGVDNATLLQDINALSSVTGVQASLDEQSNIILSAADGRNIQLTSNTNTPVATFSFFDVNSAVALDTVTVAQVKLTSQKGQVNIGGINPSDAGLTPGSFPVVPGSLTSSDYQLRFDGTFYRLTRLSDNQEVMQSLSPNMSVDGFSLTLNSGTIANGDTFLIQPTRLGAADFSLNVTQPEKLALALPIRAQGDLNNQGTGSIALTQITNTSGLPASTPTVLGNAFSNPQTLSPPIKIQFTSPTSYRVLDISNPNAPVQIGPAQSYDPNSLSTPVFPISGVQNNAPPGPNALELYDPGYRVSLQGEMQAQDEFTIEFNDDATSDNRNGLSFLSLQSDKLFQNKTATLQDTYAQMVGEVATRSAKAQTNSQASESLLKSVQARRDTLSGVNLEEEAASLIRFEQAYQAAAQIITTARNIFGILMSTFGN